MSKELLTQTFPGIVNEPTVPELQQNVDFPFIDGESSALNFFPPPYDYDFTTGPANLDVRSDHRKVIRELGSSSAVLLKNDNNALPLTTPKSLGVFGGAAIDILNGPTLADSNLGAVPMGGGSGSGRFASFYIVNDTAILESSSALYYGYLITSGLNALAPIPEVCLVFVSSYATEGLDRQSLLLDRNGTQVVEEVASICNNTVVITYAPGPVIMPFADNPNVTAIIACHYPGEEAGNSIADVLYGDVNPSGHLPYTIPLNESDFDYAPIENAYAEEDTNSNAWQSNFTEGLLVDYHHFDYHNISVAYEFGFGLSYTEFELSSLRIKKLVQSPLPTPTGKILPGGKSDLWDELYEVSVTVANVGDVAGKAVPQLYLSFPLISNSTYPNAPTTLRGFDKVELEKGEKKEVVFPLTRKDLSYWDTVQQTCVLYNGVIGTNLGFSSRNFQLKGHFSL